MAYAAEVMVVDKKSGKGKPGYKVNSYGKEAVKTDAKGMATVISSSSSITVYVEGSEIYNGSASKAPKPIICKK
jgi:hypothetical protein